MRTLSKKQKISLGIAALVIGLAASSIGFGTDENLSSSVVSVPQPTQEERIALMSGEIANIRNQLVGVEKTLQQRQNELSVRDGRIAEKNAQIAEIKQYIAENCVEPTGTYINLCKKKDMRIRNIEKEISKLSDVEKDIQALIEAKPQVEKILSEKEAEMLIMQMEG